MYFVCKSLIFSLTLALFSSIIVKAKLKGINMKININEDKYKNLLIHHRQEFHKIPEISTNLPKTKAYIMSVLETLDCEIIPVLHSGVCAFFNRSHNHTTAYRSDMDGLPITEKNTCSYTSTHEGKMHACGHDGHMSMVITLAQYVDTQKRLDSNVLIIFQPAEETTGGAKDICDLGILEKYKVNRIFGIHLWPFIPWGTISSKANAMMPRSSEINISITGKASHATCPKEGIDALRISCEYLQQIYAAHDQKKSTEVSPEERTIIQLCKLESGTARNIIPGYSKILGTIRAFSDKDFLTLIGILEGTAKEIAAKYSCDINVAHSQGYPPIINDPVLYDEFVSSIPSLDYIEMDKPAMISEDYSFYGLHVPSVFFFVGTGTGIALHSNNFDFDGGCMISGLKMYISLL